MNLIHKPYSMDNSDQIGIQIENTENNSEFYTNLSFLFQGVCERS